MNIYVHNFIFAHDSYRGRLPSIFNDYFKLSNKQHNYLTRAATMNLLLLPKKRTIIYGIKSVTYQSALAWNSILKVNVDKDFCNNSKYFCKKSISKQLLESY